MDHFGLLIVGILILLFLIFHISTEGFIPPGVDPERGMMYFYETFYSNDYSTRLKIGDLYGDKITVEYYDQERNCHYKYDNYVYFNSKIAAEVHLNDEKLTTQFIRLDDLGVAKPIEYIRKTALKQAGIPEIDLNLPAVKKMTVYVYVPKSG